MLGSLRRSALLATLAILGAGSMPAVMAQPAMVSAAPRPARASKRSLSGGVRSSLGLYGRKSAGVTAAQQKRTSRKVRNVARNRSNHR